MVTVNISSGYALPVVDAPPSERFGALPLAIISKPTFPLLTLPEMLISQSMSYLSLNDMDSLTRVNRPLHRLRTVERGRLPIAVKMQMGSRIEFTQCAMRSYMRTSAEVLPATAIEACQSLKKLVFKGIEGHSDDFLPIALPALRERALTALDITPNSLMTDSTVAQFIPLCRHLETLNLGWARDLTGKSIALIADHCPNLRMLSIHSNSLLKDVEIAKIAAKILGLVSLMISGNSILSDAAILPFIASRDMVDLDLSYNPLITDRTIFALAERATRLQSVNLAGNNNLGNEALRTLFSRCRDLREVDLTQVTAVTDETIIELVMRSPNLRKIRLSKCHRLTDRSIEMIAEHCPQLIELSIDHCLNITNRSVAPLLRCNLQRLELAIHNNFTFEAMHSLKVANPKISIGGGVYYGEGGG